MSLSKHHRSFRSGKPPYDLFISFRGEDSRPTLASHLSNYFRNSGIDAFFDQIQIKGGDHIRGKLRQAIEESNIYVIIFSEHYPNSPTCLWELENIVESAKTKPGKQILPIFYGVKRDDVRLETDLYVKQIDESTVEHWKECFQYAAEIDEGFIGNPNEDDADLCQQTLQRVKELMGTKEPPVDRIVNLRALPNLVSSPSLELVLSSSKAVCIEDCMNLDHLVRHPGRKQIEELTVRRCDMLAEIPCLGELESLKVLIIENCRSLKKLPNLSKLVELEELFITDCPCLVQVLGLSNLESLLSMEISDCDNLDFVEINLVKLQKLENLLFQNCGKLRILGHGFYENLQLLPSEHPNIHVCPLLDSEPDRDNDDENNFQLSVDYDEYSKGSETLMTPSALVVATEIGISSHRQVSWAGSSSSSSTQGVSDDSGTNFVLASQSVVVYPSWYSDKEATHHLTNNTSTLVDLSPCHGTDHEEDSATISNDCIDNWYRQLGFSASSSDFTPENTPEHTKDQQTFEEPNTLIFIDQESNFHSKEDMEKSTEEAMAVLRHFFSNSIEMAAGSLDELFSVASAIEVLLSENVSSKGDAWKKFSTNIRIAYFYCMTTTLARMKDADDETLHETYGKLVVESSMAKMNGNVRPLSDKMVADHGILVKAIKNDLQVENFERAARISDEWLGMVKEQYDLLAAYIF